MINWIIQSLEPRKSVNKGRYDSYFLKHLFEHDKANGGFYIDNGQFKGAMLQCGFRPYRKSDMNWRFCISEKSIKRVEKRGQI